MTTFQATSTGAEVRRPLATLVIGDIISATILSLRVLPALVRIKALEAVNWWAAEVQRQATLPLNRQLSAKKSQALLHEWQKILKVERKQFRIAPNGGGGNQGIRF